MQAAGSQEKAKTTVLQARTMLVESLAQLEQGKEEFDAVHKCIGILAKAFPAPPQQKLAPAQVVSMLGKK